MRVCYFFASEFDDARAALPPVADLIDTSGCPFAYWRELKARWTGEDDLLVIEQDIVIHDQVILQLDSCDRDWCLFPYIYGNGNVVNISGPQFMTRCMGCAFFSANLQRLMPLELIFDHPKAIDRRRGCSGNVCTDSDMCWQHIDQTVNHVLEAAGYEPHRHSPFVSHNHYASAVVPIVAPPPVEEMVEMILTVNPR